MFAVIRRRVECVELAEHLMPEFFAELPNGKPPGRADPVCEEAVRLGSAHDAPVSIGKYRGPLTTLTNQP